MSEAVLWRYFPHSPSNQIKKVIPLCLRVLATGEGAFVEEAALFPSYAEDHQLTGLSFFLFNLKGKAQVTTGPQVPKIYMHFLKKVFFSLTIPPS